MIIFLEGLPGSGKSYEAVLYHIVPALKAGRAVYTNIRGVDVSKIADYLDLAPALLGPLLHLVEGDVEEQKAQFLEVPRDCLVVWDEIQDFFPPSRQPLPHHWSEWVTQHRHSGVDVVLMGQDRRDMHAIWRRRVDHVIALRKMDYLGFSSSYLWYLEVKKYGDKWDRMGQGKKKYDKRVFSLYQSHRGDTKNKELMTHDRSNAFVASPVFRIGIPVVLVLVLFGGWKVYSYFHRPYLEKPPAVQGARTLPVYTPASPEVVVGGYGRAISDPVPQARPAAYVAPAPSFAAPSRGTQRAGSEAEYLKGLFTAHRAEVTGFVGSFDQGARWFAEVQFVDQAGNVAVTFSRAALEQLGAVLTPAEYGISVTIEGDRYVVPFKSSGASPWTTPGAVAIYKQRSSSLASPSDGQ